MDGWSSELPRFPGFYWMAMKSFERKPDVVQLVEIEGELKILDEELREWRPVADVWPEGDGDYWWGPLLPPPPRDEWPNRDE